MLPTWGFANRKTPSTLISLIWTLITENLMQKWGRSPTEELRLDSLRFLKTENAKPKNLEKVGSDLLKKC